MQHLDEGTIHAWLDGALSPDEGARVEAHVAECPQCAAAVAEARGFIAASSRILTALDHVPRGVVPVARPARWSNPAMWRAAAALLVVAAGSLMVVRNTGDKSAATTVLTVRKADNAPVVQQASPALIAENSPQTTPTTGLQRSSGPTANTTGGRGTTGAVAATEQKPGANTKRVADLGKATASSAEPSITATDNSAAAAPTAPPAPAAGSVADRVSPSSGYATTQPAPPKIMLRGAMSLGAMDSVTTLAPLKVVGTPRQLGAKVTLYEVTPKDTVTLTEFTNLQLESVVTSMPTPRQRVDGQVAGKAAAAAAPQSAEAPVLNPQDSRREAAAAAARSAPIPAPITAIETANGVVTITWTDGASGNVMKLSGRMPAPQLLQTKVRIERMRAEAAAAARKNP